MKIGQGKERKRVGGRVRGKDWEKERKRRGERKRKKEGEKQKERE